MSDIDIEKVSENLISNPERHSGLPANEIPVGAILPYAPPGLIQLPEGWYVCAGQTVRDSASPFFGKNVPNLVDGRFPMGTIRPDEYQKLGGSNQIPLDGAHNHGGRTGGDVSRRGADRDDDFQVSTRGHSHSIGLDGAHTHGGDNRPQFFGLIYIIRIK